MKELLILNCVLCIISTIITCICSDTVGIRKFEKVRFLEGFLFVLLVTIISAIPLVNIMAIALGTEDLINRRTK